MADGDFGEKPPWAEKFEQVVADGLHGENSLASVSVVDDPTSPSKANSRANSGRTPIGADGLPSLGPNTPNLSEDDIRKLLTKAMKAARAELQAEHQRLREDRVTEDALRKERTSKETDALSLERADFAERNSSLTREVTELKQKRFDLEKELGRKDTEMEAMKTKLAELEHQQRQDKAKEANICAALSFSRNDNETLRSKVAELQAELQRLEGESAGLPEMADKVRRLEKELEDEHTLRKNVHSISKDEVNRLHATIQELRDDCADQRQRYVLLMLQKKNLEKDMSGYRDYANSMRERCDLSTDELWARLQASEQIQTKVQDDHYALKLEMDKLRWNRQEERYKFEAESNKLKSEVRRLKNDLERARNQPFSGRKEPAPKPHPAEVTQLPNPLPIPIIAQKTPRDPTPKSSRKPKEEPPPRPKTPEKVPQEELRPEEPRYPPLNRAPVGGNRHELRLSMDTDGQPPSFAQVLGNTQGGGWADRSRWGSAVPPAAPGWDRAHMRNQLLDPPPRNAITPPVPRKTTASFDWRQSLEEPWSNRQRPQSQPQDASQLSMRSRPQRSSLASASSISSSVHLHPPVHFPTGKENSRSSDSPVGAELLDMIGGDAGGLKAAKARPKKGTPTPNPEHFETSSKFKRFQKQHDRDRNDGVLGALSSSDQHSDLRAASPSHPVELIPTDSTFEDLFA